MEKEIVEHLGLCGWQQWKEGDKERDKERAREGDREFAQRPRNKESVQVNVKVWEVRERKRRITMEVERQIWYIVTDL